MGKCNTPEKMSAALTPRGIKPKDSWPTKSYEKVWWVCPEGHEWAAVYSNLQQGSGCPHCAGLAPVTPEKMSAALTPRGIKPKDSWPTKSYEKVWWVCPEGHEWATVYSDLQQGSGCPHCAGLVPVTPEKMSAVLTPRGIKPKDSWPTKSHEKVWWVCPEGHEWATVYGVLQQGSGCPHCAGKAPVTPEKMSAVLTPRGIKPKDSWPTKSYEKVWWVCPEGHEWATVYSDLQQGKGCPHCARDRLQPNGIYHLSHPDHPHQYIGISFKPSLRLKQHQEDTGPRGELARELKSPYEYTVEEVYTLLATAELPTDVDEWFSANPFGRIDYHGTVVDMSWSELPSQIKAKPARVPRFVADFLETELIEMFSNKFPSDNPFLQAGKVPLVNVAKNYTPDAVSA
jgi:hypothetical protein